MHLRVIHTATVQPYRRERKSRALQAVGQRMALGTSNTTDTGMCSLRIFFQPGCVAKRLLCTVTIDVPPCRWSMGNFERIFVARAHTQMHTHIHGESWISSQAVKLERARVHLAEEDEFVAERTECATRPIGKPPRSCPLLCAHWGFSRSDWLIGV